MKHLETCINRLIFFNEMDRIQTLHPTGKQGVNIEKEKYGIIRHAILKYLDSEKLSFSSLKISVEKTLENKFDGSIGWYVETVKLDLEARNIIKRIPDTKPQLYQLVSSE